MEGAVATAGWRTVAGLALVAGWPAGVLLLLEDFFGLGMGPPALWVFGGGRFLGLLRLAVNNDR
jgi:hypothetical protein